MVTLGCDRMATDYAQYRSIHPHGLESLLHTGELEASSRVFEVGCLWGAK